MNRTQALPYVAHAIDDAGASRTGESIPADATLVGWQAGFEPVFVAVWSNLPGVTVEQYEAAELATDYLDALGWFADGPTEPDYII